MIDRSLAEVVVAVHFAFVLYVVLGGFLAWRWPRSLPLHVASAVYALGIVVIGWDCPLTTLENHFRRVGGESDYRQGFIDRYMKDVIFPHQFTSALRVLVAVLVVVSWIGLEWRHRHRQATVQHSPL
jgi:hypothetical protein